MKYDDFLFYAIKALKKKKSMFSTNGTAELNRLLLLLYRDSLILSFNHEYAWYPDCMTRRNEGFYTIYLANDSLGLPIMRKIRVLSNNEPIYINVKTVEFLANHSDYQWGLVRTTRGLYTLADCVKRKMGGQLLALLLT